MNAVKRLSLWQIQKLHTGYLPGNVHTYLHETQHYIDTSRTRIRRYQSRLSFENKDLKNLGLFQYLW